MNYLQRQRLRLHVAAAHLRRRQLGNICVRLGSLVFRSPVGVAAGLDRHGRLLASFDKLGAGFVEVGTINNHGDAPITARRIARWQRKRQGKQAPMRIGVSIGSLRPSLDTMAIEECVALAQMFAPLADYLVFNLSRPRSPVRQGRFELQQLHTALVRVRAGCAANPAAIAPHLLVKIAVTPDRRNDYPPDVMQLFANHCDGIVIAFEDWPSVTAAAGWLSSRHPALPVIAVGGIRHATDIEKYLAAGAALVGVHRAIRSVSGLYSLFQDPFRRRQNGVDLGQ